MNPLSHDISRQHFDVLTFLQCNPRQRFLHLCPFTTSHAPSNPAKCPLWSLPCCDRSYRGCAAPWPRSAGWCALPLDRKIPQAGGSCQRDETRAELREERLARFVHLQNTLALTEVLPSEVAGRDDESLTTRSRGLDGEHVCVCEVAYVDPGMAAETERVSDTPNVDIVLTLTRTKHHTHHAR